MRWTLAPSVIAALLVSGITLAETAEPRPPPPPPAASAGGSAQPTASGASWYGWQILAVDGAAIATGAVLANTLDFAPREQPSDLGMIGASWYGLGAVAAPGVHYAHGNAAIGTASLGLRVLVPPVAGFFGFLGSCMENGDVEHECVVDGYSVGTLVGLAGASAIDVGLLAWDRPKTDSKPAGSWYGWQLFIVDGAAIGTGIVIGASKPRNEEGERTDPVAAPWAMGYLVGLVAGPVVHFSHGRWGRAFISLGARALAGPMFAVMGVAGYCAATGGVSDCSKTGALYGLLGGLAIVDVFDALVLAHEEVEPNQQARYTPTVSVGPNSLTVGGYF